MGTADTQSNVTQWPNGRKTQTEFTGKFAFLIKHHALKTVGIELWLQTCLTSSPDQAERSVWFPGAFSWSKEALATTGERPAGAHYKFYICDFRTAVLYQIQELYTVQHNTLIVNIL
jgi:hypothetical protein